jgi:hypothetical protein
MGKIGIMGAWELRKQFLRITEFPFFPFLSSFRAIAPAPRRLLGVRLEQYFVKKGGLRE